MVSVTDHDFSGGARPSPHRHPGEDAARGGLPEEADGFAVARGRLCLPQVVPTCGPWFGRCVRDRGLRYDVDRVNSSTTAVPPNHVNSMFAIVFAGPGWTRRYLVVLDDPV